MSALRAGAALVLGGATILALVGWEGPGVRPGGEGTPTPAVGSPPAADGAPGHAAHAPPPAAPSPPSLDGRSVYRLPGTWRDRDGRPVTLADLGGRVQVIAMVYTHCAYACPRILAMMKRIEGTLEEEAGGRVGFTLVSIDPERDRPARLRTFAEESRLDTDRWTLLNGDDERILELSVLLGVKYRATADGGFAHSNLLTILDPGGVIVKRVEGLGADVGPAVAAIRSVLDR